ncbi:MULTISPECIES: alternative ribosome rescue aminoacyl-tRNA hydrolase ArfB [Microbulbifer]|uniref:Alternative ribosome rescue aminoacyl-tRNA hydrolase ArfB n=1 Tax=Microbulbifer celer TaxID=435905 RepID=A0ABW3UCI5_9GAMM|nr:MULTISPECIES: alternative ribosome rescue aminoacyl-tRNA hydrolase ArfB [Microbulbifer]UFN55970.1 aminoacyl-tRNA hydrolase [Microbulbifer celer]
MLIISNHITISEHEITWNAVRAQGSGGQNVNKVSSAIHLRFDVQASSLPEEVKSRVLALRDQRISSDGVVIIKAQRFRTQEKNRTDALERLRTLILSAMKKPKKRVPTKPTRGSKERRLKSKARRGQVKSLRGKVPDH